MKNEKLNIPRATFHKTSHPGVLYLVSMKTGKVQKVFYIRYRDADGRAHFEKAGRAATTPAKAAAIRGDRIRGKEKPNEDRREEKQAAKREAESKWTFNRLWEAWQEDPENEGKRGTIKTDQRYRKHIKGLFGDREPSDLRPIDIDRLRLSLAGSHSKETTISVLGLIRRLSRYAAAKDICPGLSFPIILKGKKLGRDPKEKRIPNDAEIAAYIETCKKWPDPQAGNFQLFIVYTGVRRGSVRNLKWEDVDLKNRTALLRDSKTGDVQIVLSDDALALLKSHPRTKGNDYVFTGSDPDGKRSQREIDRIPAEIRDAAGLPSDLDPCHSFRRNLATRLGREGISPITIMRLGGWKTPAMVMHHTATEKETLREAANLLGRRIGEAEANGKT